MTYLRICLSFFFISTFSAGAQSAWKSFWKLSCPEKTWVITHPFVAGRAFRITGEVLRIADEMKSDPTLDGDALGGQVDAFRHSFWMASLAQQICWKKALKLGKAHEKGNYRQFKKRKKDEEGVLPDAISGDMDLYNNQVGVSIGCNHKNLDPAGLKNLIVSSIFLGKMKVIWKNKKGIPLDKQGIPIDLKDVKDLWEIPKTLVPSNVQPVN